MTYKILIVDDEPAIVRLCEQILRRASYQVTTARDPYHALELLAHADFDLLLVDIRMPMIDGFELARRGREFHPNLANLAMTSYGTVSVAIEAIQKGMDGLILKPFENENLVATIKQTLVEKKLAVESARASILQPLIQAGHNLLAEIDFDKLLDLIILSLKDLLKVDFAGIYSRHPSGNHLECLGASEQTLPFNLTNLELFLGDSFQASAAPVFTWAGWSLENSVEIGVRSWMLAVVHHPNEEIVFCVGRSNSKPELVDGDYRLFTVFINQAAIALMNALLYSQLSLQVRMNLVDTDDLSETGVRDIAGSYVAESENAGVEIIKENVYLLKNGLMIDCNKRYAQRFESLVSLTPSEAVILTMLLENYGQVVSHRKIVQRLQGYDLSNQESAKIIRPLISRLREKMQIFGLGEKDLRNVRGSGYLLEIAKGDFATGNLSA